MLQFKEPKKKKSLRKKEKFDVEALEAEAKTTSLGASDLGSRKDQSRIATKIERERAEVQLRTKAYESALQRHRKPLWQFQGRKLIPWLWTRQKKSSGKIMRSSIL